MECLTLFWQRIDCELSFSSWLCVVFHKWSVCRASEVSVVYTHTFTLFTWSYLVPLVRFCFVSFDRGVPIWKNRNHSHNMFMDKTAIAYRAWCLRRLPPWKRGGVDDTRCGIGEKLILGSMASPIGNGLQTLVAPPSKQSIASLDGIPFYYYALLVQKMELHLSQFPL